MYTQGNWTQLKRCMAQYCDTERPHCLYFGDHLIQDVLAASRMRVETVAIVEEMAAEGMVGVAAAADRAALHSPMWGSLFHDPHGSSSDTVWSGVIKHHARLCIPDVETLAALPVGHRFVPASCPATLTGFLPALPSSFS